MRNPTLRGSGTPRRGWQVPPAQEEGQFSNELINRTVSGRRTRDLALTKTSLPSSTLRRVPEFDIGAEFERVEIPVAVARQMREGAHVLPHRGAVDEAERRREVPPDLLEHEIAGPRLIGEVQRERRRISSLALEVSSDTACPPQNHVAGEIRYAVLDVRARDGIVGQAARIAIGDDEAEFRFGEDPTGRARDRQNLAVPARRRPVRQHAERADVEAAELPGQFVANRQAHLPPLHESDVAREERPSVVRGPVPGLRP